MSREERGEGKTQPVVLIKGAGEVASGVAHRLFRSHFRVCMTEIHQPQAVSRGVAFCEVIHDGEKEVEGVIAKLVASKEEILKAWEEQRLPLLVDPEASVKEILHPGVVIDAIMAKKNLGTEITDAPLVIGLGPGFYAGRDVHMVVETSWSDNLGRVILEGEAEKDTGIPIPICGLTLERVLHAPTPGLFLTNKEIGDVVATGEVVASVGGQPVRAEVSGVIRALLRSGIEVKRDTKLGEIDPSGNKEACFHIRGRIRAIAGGVLEAILMHYGSAF